MTRPTAALVVFAGSILTCLASPPIAAQDAAGERLIVATKEAAPFAMRGADGAWEGITISLWTDIAAELGLEFEFREATVAESLAGLRDGTFDVVAAALTITAEREAEVDFCHAHYSSGLAIGVPYEHESGFANLMRALLSLEFFQAIGALALVILIFGVLVWLFERRGNSEEFGGGVVKGLASGFWWSAVTMTTVGYGDKSPRTFGGRIIGLIWMFTAIVTISSLTAGIASVLTVGQLSSGIRGPEDLGDVSVGVVEGTTGESFVRARRPRRLESYASIGDAVTGLIQGEAALDAVVHDAPLLLYLANTTFEGRLDVLPGTFDHQEYAIALQQGSPLREQINRVLLEKTTAPSWEELLYRYTGE